MVPTLDVNGTRSLNPDRPKRETPDAICMSQATASSRSTPLRFFPSRRNARGGITCTFARQ